VDAARVEMRAGTGPISRHFSIKNETTPTESVSCTGTATETPCGRSDWSVAAIARGSRQTARWRWARPKPPSSRSCSRGSIWPVRAGAPGGNPAQRRRRPTVLHIFLRLAETLCTSSPRPVLRRGQGSVCAQAVARFLLAECEREGVEVGRAL